MLYICTHMARVGVKGLNPESRKQDKLTSISSLFHHSIRQIASVKTCIHISEFKLYQFPVLPSNKFLINCKQFPLIMQLPCWVQPQISSSWHLKILQHNKQTMTTDKLHSGSILKTTSRGTTRWPLWHTSLLLPPHYNEWQKIIFYSSLFPTSSKSLSWNCSTWRVASPPTDCVLLRFHSMLSKIIQMHCQKIWLQSVHFPFKFS